LRDQRQIARLLHIFQVGGHPVSNLEEMYSSSIHQCIGLMRLTGNKAVPDNT